MVYDDFDSVPHAFGLVATARLYREAPGDRRYDAFATAQRDWVFGANAWGTSFMVGEGTNFERCPQHVVANLSGHGSRYVDDVRSWQTSEPADDFTALGLYALTLTARGADR